MDRDGNDPLLGANWRRFFVMTRLLKAAGCRDAFLPRNFAPPLSCDLRARGLGSSITLTHFHTEIQ